MTKIKPPVPESDKRYRKDSLEYELSSLLIYLVNNRSNVYARYMDNLEYIELLKQKHAYYFDKLLNKDGKDIHELLMVLEWSQENKFWRQNIKSSYKFREKYDTIFGQMEDQPVEKLEEDDYPEFTEGLINAFCDLISNRRYQPSVKEHNKFIEATKKMIKFFEARNIHDGVWVNYLKRCLIKNFQDQGLTIYPGNFNSDHTWGILMSQYMEEIGL